jgi:hypothetical protein
MCARDCYTACALLARRAPLDLLTLILYHISGGISIGKPNKLLRQNLCKVYKIAKKRAPGSLARVREKRKRGDFSPECRLALGLSRAFGVSGFGFDFRSWRLLRLGVLCFSHHPALLLYHKTSCLSRGFAKFFKNFF